MKKVMWQSSGGCWLQTDRSSASPGTDCDWLCLDLGQSDLTVIVAVQVSLHDLRNLRKELHQFEHHNDEVFQVRCLSCIQGTLLQAVSQ